MQSYIFWNNHQTKSVKFNSGPNKIVTFEAQNKQADTLSMFIGKIMSFLCGWIADRIIGDPEDLPHPVVWFGKVIHIGEKKLNYGTDRILKGALLTGLLVAGVYCTCWYILKGLTQIHEQLGFVFVALGVFYCLAGKTLSKEVKAVFEAVGKSTEEGRKQLSRIVGRDTSALTPQQIRTAALETLAENLSDGVIAPMFWFIILGLPGMMAYKMINTLDSMIGYKNDRYYEFGRIAAKLDDVANYIPARLTAGLMLLITGNWNKYNFVKAYGKMHASPNSGYPEAALAAILDCRFGGPNFYSGKLVDKPYIGNNPRELTTNDMLTAIQTNSRAELLMGILVCGSLWILNLI